MRLGLRLPLQADDMAHAARLAEEVGFDSVWVGEAYNRGLLLADPLIALGIAAVVTRRVEIGTHVVQVPLRSPFLLASQAASLAIAAPGRFVMGVGAGSTAADFQATGVRFSDRFKLLDDNLCIMRRLLAGEEVDGAQLSPNRTLPAIPTLVGTSGSGRWLRKAALEFDGWIASMYMEDVKQILEGLDRFRELAPGKRAIASNVQGQRPDAADVLGIMAEAGFDDATVTLDRYDDESIEKARSLLPH